MTDSPKREREHIFYFCDETSFIGAEEYMGVGGLAIRRSRIPETVKALAKICNDCGARGEIKWETTRDLNLGVRKAYIDFMVNLIRESKAHLHLRFAPFQQYNHNESGPRRIFDTVSKMYYQLLLHRAVRKYGPQCRIFIRPDDGSCTSKLENFIEALHADGYLKYKAEPDCIDSIICLNSRNEPLLQFLDVSIGALTAYRNGRHLRPETNEAKRVLAEHAYHVFEITDLTKNSDERQKASIWNVIPQKRGPRR